MERPKRSRGTAPGGVAADAALANITELIDNGGQITLGAVHPIKCAAIATDGHACVAMLQRQPAETLQQLLERLDTAIGRARTTHERVDEINAPPRKPLR